jgi:hypothetical protein
MQRRFRGPAQLTLALAAALATGACARGESYRDDTAGGSVTDTGAATGTGIDTTGRDTTGRDTTGRDTSDTSGMSGRRGTDTTRPR